MRKGAIFSLSTLSLVGGLAFTTISSFSQDICPSHVVPQTPKSVAEGRSGLAVKPGNTSVKPAKDLPHDGWVIWPNRKEHKTYYSRLKTMNPKEIKTDAGEPIVMQRNSFLPDGKWAAGGVSVNKSKTYFLGFVNIGTGKLHLFNDIPASVHVHVWYNSPKEKPEQSIYEVAYKTKDKVVKATLFDFSGDKPVKLETRTVATGLGNMEEFAIAGDLMVADDGPSKLYTISDGGLGTATKANGYNEKRSSKNNCGAAIAPSASRWFINHNYERGSYCSPGDHDGLSVLKTKRAGIDPIISEHDWHGVKPGSSQEHAIAVVHIPVSLESGGKTYKLSTTSKDHHWFGSKFLNDENFIVMFNNKTHFSAFVADIRTGDFYQVVPADHFASGVAVWFDNVPVQKMNGGTPAAGLSLKINSPANGAEVETGKEVKIDLEISTKDVTVKSVAIKLDGQLIKTLTAAPWTYTITNIEEGARSVSVEATDSKDNKTTKVISFTAKSKSTLTKIELKGGPLTVTPNQTLDLMLTAKDQYGKLMENFDLGSIEWIIPSDIGTVNGNSLTVTGTQKDQWLDIQFKAKGLSGSSKIQIADGMPVGDGLWTKMMVLQEVGSDNWSIPNTYDFEIGLKPIPGAKLKIEGKDYEWKIIENEQGDFIKPGKHKNKIFIFGINFFSPEARTVKMKAVANDEMIKAMVNSLNSVTPLIKTGYTSAPKLSGAFEIQEGNNHLVMAVKERQGDARFKFSLVAQNGDPMSDLRVILSKEVESIAEGYKITSHKEGDILAIGEKIPLTWIAGPDEEECVPMLKIKHNEKWYELFLTRGGGSVSKEKDDQANPLWGNIEFTIPSAFRISSNESFQLAGKEARLMVFGYLNNNIVHSLNVTIDPIVSIRNGFKSGYLGQGTLWSHGIMEYLSPDHSNAVRVNGQLR